MYPQILAGQTWKSKNSGRVYKVEMLTNTDGNDPKKKDKFPPTVVYSETEGGTFWSCPIEEWKKSSKFLIQN